MSAGGAVTAADPHAHRRANDDAAVNHGQRPRRRQRRASSDLLEPPAAVSRDSRRDALADAADADLVEEAEAKAEQRNAALAQFAKQAEAQAEEARAQPVGAADRAGCRLTAEFGEYGLWAQLPHRPRLQRLRRATPIKAIANGVVTSAGYDGSYGNKTVVTLEDGTEIWYCHQSAFGVSEGDEVRAGEVIGYVGSTGNVTGSHLHLEVRPGGGDPVDPCAAFARARHHLSLTYALRNS